MPPAQIIKNELPSVPSGVLSQLPERENSKKMLRRTRRSDLPKYPVRLSELGGIPERFTKTLLGENFLIFDSYESEDSDSEEDTEERSRVIVFGTRRNLELLGRSHTWFLDGTFKVCPAIFVQIFTISGLVTRVSRNGEEESISVPLVFAFLSSKQEVQYSRVLEAITDAARDQRVSMAEPARTISDFEIAILNAVKKNLKKTAVAGCFFHFGQSGYRKVGMY